VGLVIYLTRVLYLGVEKIKLVWLCQLQKLSTLLLGVVVHKFFGSNNNWKTLDCMLEMCLCCVITQVL